MQQQQHHHSTSPAPSPPLAPTLVYSWSEYNPDLRLLYLRSHTEADLELSKLGSHSQALGFDIEWKPTFRKGEPESPVALVQLSNHDTIFLLQISSMQEFPSKLAEILANPLIVKAGVGIQNDSKKMYHDCSVPMYNCVDLSLLARTVDNARWKGKYNNPLGLARLIEAYEFRVLPKGRITRSNWEANLNDRQLEYASNDAHAGYILYKKLEAMISLLADPPESVWYTFNLVSGELVNSDGFSWHAHNPNYDPGPPPPPRIPREPKSTDNQGAQSHSSTVKKPGSSQPPRSSRPNHKYLSAEKVGEGRSGNDVTRPPFAASIQGTGQTHGHLGSRTNGPVHRRIAHQQYRSTADPNPQTSHMAMRAADAQDSGAFSMGSSAQLHDASRDSGPHSNNRGRKRRGSNRS